MGKAVASGPIRTLRARRALWVVHTFFMRASDNPLSEDSGARCVRLEEAQNLFANVEILAYVYIALGVPAPEKIWLVAFREEQTHHDLGSQFVIGSIEGHRGDGVASIARPEFPVHPRTGERLLLAKSRLSLHPCNITRITPSCRKPTMTLYVLGHKLTVVNLRYRLISTTAPSVSDSAVNFHSW